MRVDELLSRKGPRIISVRFDETVETAAKILRDENIGAIVVKDVCANEGEVVFGMFSERDFVHAIISRGPGILKKPVSSLMTPNVISCNPRDDVAKAIELMKNHHIRHLPVIDGTDLIGVISIRDIVALIPAGAVSVEAFEPA
jgi:CBS domain-containing protein